MTTNTKATITTTGDMRKLLANLALDVIRGDVKANEAAVAINAFKQINASLYSEIKTASLRMELGEAVSKLGSLPIGEA